jgi:hypothetical protein
MLRMHVCWGNYEGPHHHDVPLADIVDLVLAARPAAVSFEAANPRHAHEWTVFEDVALPEGKILVPGVLDSTTNYIEHPDLVAQRIVRVAGSSGARTSSRAATAARELRRVAERRPGDRLGEARGAGRGRTARDARTLVTAGACAGVRAPD